MGIKHHGSCIMSSMSNFESQNRSIKSKKQGSSYHPLPVLQACMFDSQIAHLRCFKLDLLSSPQISASLYIGSTIQVLKTR